MLNGCCDYLICCFLLDNLEVFTRGKERGVRTKTDIPINKFVAEYEANVLSADEAERRESRHSVEGEDIYMLEATYNSKRVVFDATYRFGSIARLINHSRRRANILLRQPIEIRGKLRIGFIAKRDIRSGEELLFDYDLASYSTSELPEWYKQSMMESDSDDASESDNNPEPANTSQPVLKEPKLKMCKVPGCGVTVKRIWNHIYGVHKDLSGTWLQLLCMVTVDRNLFRADMMKMLYLNESNKSEVDITQQKGRRVALCTRGMPFHSVDNSQLTELKR